MTAGTYAFTVTVADSSTPALTAMTGLKLAAPPNKLPKRSIRFSDTRHNFSRSLNRTAVLINRV